MIWLDLRIEFIDILINCDYFIYFREIEDG
jgi:hypothetical protein